HLAARRSWPAPCSMVRHSTDKGAATKMTTNYKALTNLCILLSTGVVALACHSEATDDEGTTAHVAERLSSAAATHRPSPPSPARRPPGRDPAGPGNSESAPGHDPAGPGNSESAPGHDPAGPGNSASTPGQNPASPGNSTNAPGHDPAGPGNSANAPGHDPA